MDQPISPVSQPTEPVQQFQPQHSSPTHSRRTIAIAVITGVLVLAGAVFAYTKITNKPATSPSPTATPSTSEKWKAHIDTKYSFSFWYPAYYSKKEGVTPPQDDPSLAAITYYDTLPEGSAGGFSVAIYAKALTHIPTLYQGDLSLSDSESMQVDGRTVYFHRDGDGGCAGTDYYLPLSSSSYARIGMGDCEGEVTAILPNAEIILNSFRFSAQLAQAPSLAPLGGTPISEWKSFTSKYFTLSFKVPPTYEVTDLQDTIIISKGPYREYEIGSDNAIMRLKRFTGSYTRASAEANFRESNRDVGSYSLTVDGTSFTRLSGTDNGSSSEGTSRGTTWLVLFEKSAISAYMEESNATTYADWILSTFKFTK